MCTFAELKSHELLEEREANFRDFPRVEHTPKLLSDFHRLCAVGNRCLGGLDSFRQQSL